MATRTITLEWEVDGVLVDPTSVRLSNEAGTAGVVRDDTGAVVVADGTAMTREGTGVYSHTFTEPDEGLSYTSYLEIVYLGTTHRYENDLPATPPALITPTVLPPLSDILDALLAEVQTQHADATRDDLPESDLDELKTLTVTVSPRYPDGRPALETQVATREANRYIAHCAVILQQHIADAATSPAVETAANALFAYLNRRRLSEYPAAVPSPPELLASPSPEHLARRVACHIIAVDYRVIV